MYTIKRKYYNKTKKHLKELNKYFYNSDRIIIIHNIDNSFNITNKNNDFNIWENNFNVICEIIESVNNSKNFVDFDLQNFIKESLI